MSSNWKSSRREFLKTFTLLTASSTLFGKSWLVTIVAQTAPGGGVLRLKLSDYPPLQQANGSVRIGTSALVGASTCPRPAGLIPPLLINRGAGNQFFALEAACSHEGCTVPVYNSGLGFSQCPNHGSRYTIDGTCIRGPNLGSPIAPLRSFVTRFDGVNALAVELTDPWNFELKSVGVQPGSPSRFALNFLALEALEYEVYYRASLTDDGLVVPFSTTPAGPADQTVFVGPQFGTFQTVYVDRVSPAGFYSVAMRIREV
jgi:Rieske Fe-S protein